MSVSLLLGWQRTLASSKWEQSPVFRSYLQSISLPSDPVHCTSSRRIWPLPRPKWAFEKADASMCIKRTNEACTIFNQKVVFCLLNLEYPNCLQATLASSVPHRSSHTVPQRPERHISTRPSYEEEPPTSLMLSSTHWPPVQEYKRVETNQRPAFSI